MSEMGGEMPALGLIGNIPKNKIKKSSELCTGGKRPRAGGLARRRLFADDSRNFLKILAYWVLFNPNDLPFRIFPQELQDSCEQPMRFRAHSGRFAAY